MAMLWQNLVGNAVKFRREGVVPRIEIDCRRVDQDGVAMWSISLADNGIGIAAEFSEKVFVIFQRLHVRHEYSGAGVGLAICKRVVERHGGRIWVESEPGKGAAFYFTLPMEMVIERGEELEDTWKHRLSDPRTEGE